MDDMLKYVKVDEAQAKKDLKEVEREIKSLQVRLKDLEQRKSLLDRVVSLATGDIDLGLLSKATSRAKPKSESVDPQQVVDYIKSNGGSATLDELKRALGVGGRVIGGALRKDDRLTKDADGNYTVTA